MKHTILSAAYASLLLILSGTAQAVLIDRGGGLIYDTDRNITWLADANYARTSGYDADGRMTWSSATTWVSNLSYYDSVRNVTWDDWRLPTTLQPDPTCSYQSGGFSSGNYCSGSELGHMFYSELGVPAGYVFSASTDPDVALFTNIQSSNTNPYYWSQEYVSSIAWAFNFYNGHQTTLSKSGTQYVWAVRDGDVGASVVPVPAAVWLFGSGLLGLIGVARRQKAA